MKNFSVKKILAPIILLSSSLIGQAQLKVDVSEVMVVGTNGLTMKVNLTSTFPRKLSVNDLSDNYDVYVYHPVISDTFIDEGTCQTQYEGLSFLLYEGNDTVDVDFLPVTDEILDKKRALISKKITMLPKNVAKRFIYIDLTGLAVKAGHTYDCEMIYSIPCMKKIFKSKRFKVEFSNLKK